MWLIGIGFTLLGLIIGYIMGGKEGVDSCTNDNESVYFTSKEKAEEFMNWMNKDLPNNLWRANKYY